MNVLSEASFTIEEDELLLTLGGDLEKGEKAKSIIRENISVIEEGKALVQPLALYDAFDVESAEGGQLRLKNGDCFNSRLFPLIMSGAKEVFLCIVTIGAQLEERASQYMKQFDYEKGILLDSTGTLALQKVGMRVYEGIKEYSWSIGSNYSSPLSPGQVDWDVKDQGKIFSRLQAHRWGMSLTSSGLIFPKKSTTMIVGVGGQVEASKEACNFCPLNKTCPSRKVKDYERKKRH